MIHVKDIKQITGYIRGGCCPIGMKKLFKTILHKSIEDYEAIFISGGRLGLQIEINPKELVRIVRGEPFDVVFK